MMAARQADNLLAESRACVAFELLSSEINRAWPPGMAGGWVFMKRALIKNVLNSETPGETILIHGWVRT
ncbi:MAG TPA: hypothetical protein VHH88_03480, partial [Verrucomicrobiae bacterium]|nr:hypothetical protein [Verrucomicrobiae bacterium]